MLYLVLKVNAVQTYNLKKVSEHNNFFANGFLAHNKGGGGPPPGDTIAPTINLVRYSIVNPVIGTAFTVEIDAADTTPASDLEYAITIDENKDGNFNEPPVTGKNTANPITLNPPQLDGVYQIQIRITDAAGNETAYTGTLTTNPHPNIIKDGTVTDMPTFGISGGYTGDVLTHARTHLINKFGSGSVPVTDLDALTTALSSTETLTRFNLNGNDLEVFVNDTANSNFTDSDNDGNKDWAGVYELPTSTTTASDLDDYFNATINSAEAQLHAAYFRMQTTPNTQVVNPTYNGTAANPDLNDMLAGTIITLPTVPNGPAGHTIFRDYIQVEYSGGSPLTKYIIFDPNALEKSDIANYASSLPTAAKQSIKVVVFEGTYTKKDIDTELHAR